MFVSSHLLSEVEQMCTHAAVMSAGNMVAQGTLADLRAGGAGRVAVRTPGRRGARAVLARLGLVPEAGAEARTKGGATASCGRRWPTAARSPSGSSRPWWPPGSGCAGSRWNNPASRNGSSS